MFNYAFELFEFSEAITPYGTIDTKAPDKTNIIIDNFSGGNHFKTTTNADGNLILDLENKIITLCIDSSGSMTWNDNHGDRYIYFRRLLNRLNSTYPGTLTTNLIEFLGEPVLTRLLAIKSGDEKTVNESIFDFENLLEQKFENSVFDIKSIRVVRRPDRMPNNPFDGTVVSDEIVEAVEDDELTTGTQYYYGIWVLNKNGHYSSGKFISETPRNRLLPFGVSYISSNPRILPGVNRDSYTQIIYNFAEKSGNIIYDSSGNGNHGSIGSQSLLDNFWLGDSQSSVFVEDEIKSPSGVLFDGLFDVISTTTTVNMAVIGSGQPSPQALTINLWMFRYISNGQAWVIGTTNSVTTNNVGWAVGVNANGNILLSVQESVLNGFSVTTTAVVPEKQWTMVTIVIDTASRYTVYLDGVEFSSAITYGSLIDTSSFDELLIGGKITEDSVTWSGFDYFGCLAQISISNTLRSLSWIQNTYEMESKIFNRKISDIALNPPDNKQREVLINWKISEDFNFSGGTVRIVRKYQSIPSHPDDGTTVLQTNASYGDFYFLDIFDFIHNGNYYYRIYTYNSLGNVCEQLEARATSCHIQRSNNDVPNTALETVQNINITNGNRKIYLQWTTATDERIRGTKILFGTATFPTIDVSAQGDILVSNGVEIEDTTSNFFVHRTLGKTCDGEDVFLNNGQLYFYTLLHYDELGRFSSPVTISGIPNASSTEPFLPDDVKNLHISVINNSTLSIKWDNPTLKNDRLDLFFGDKALVFVNIKNLYGNNLSDLKNLKLFVCTQIEPRTLSNNEEKIKADHEFGDFTTIFNEQKPCSEAPLGFLSQFKGGGFGNEFDPECNSSDAIEETVVLGKTVSNGLVSGTITHTNNRAILKRRERYVMNVFAIYKIQNQEAVDPESDEASLFKFITKPFTVTFTNPIQIKTVNKLNKYISIECENTGGVRILDKVCICDNDDKKNSCNDKTYNGGYIKAKIPYVCRVEIQHKGESLPDGFPVNVQLFKHDDGNSLILKSDRTIIKEGQYLTSAILEDELNNLGQPTGKTIPKSIVDIEITHPDLPDHVDIYITVDYGESSADTVHVVKFISSLFIKANITKPEPNGIESAEQFATAWQVNPDDPDNPDANIPVPNGTPVKWELIPLRHGKSRPFYSTNRQNTLVSGVYSTTTSGIARQVFFGPISNLEKHTEEVVCKGDGGVIESADSCCLSEEYEIDVSISLNEQTAVDKVQIAYPCDEIKTFSSKRFLMNAAENQPGSNPHWITWADGIHLLKFQIAKNPAISTMMGARCFRECVEEKFGGQSFTFANGQIIQITAPGEIMWNVIFDTDPYTNISTPISYSSAKPNDEDPYNTTAIANIPINNESTDFYIRLNKFISDDKNPKPQECKSTENGSGGKGSSGEDIDPCQWKSLCSGISVCIPEEGKKWNNVSVVSGVTTLISKNKEITLFGGGDYKTGIPPIYVGFKEPLNISILEARVNGQPVGELKADGFSIHTFVAEVTFAGETVPDGTEIEITTDGNDQNIVKLSNNVVYTRNINDSLINPTGDKRSLAFFNIEPLPNINFSAKINLTCRYDKLGTAQRAVTRCVQLSNQVADQNNQEDTQLDELEININSATSNELILYDTINNTYSVKTGSIVNRMGHFFAYSTESTIDKIFSIGGWTGNTDSQTANITPTCEVFNIVNESWSFTTNMPTARCFGMTAHKNGKIYCIGGIELDPLLRQNKVSRKIESFDVLSEQWNSTLAPMPDSYGVAYGDAQVIGDYIYITCGVTSIIDNSTPDILNDKILRYSISQDSWIKITPSDVTNYKRITPFGFYRSTYSNQNSYYIYGGAVVKTSAQIESERTAKINQLLNELYSFILTSTYFQNLTVPQQQDFIATKEENIRNNVFVPAFIYPKNGFKFEPGTEILLNDAYEINTSDSLENEWKNMPFPRNFGKCVYSSKQDIAYFFGGSNQNVSTTLNKVEAIDFVSNNTYEARKKLSRGRAMFATALVSDTVYISGGLTSGHKDGWCQIFVENKPEFIEATGIQSGGVFVTVVNDSGELLDTDITIEAQGKLNVQAINNLLIDYAAQKAANRILGDQSGEPNSGDIVDINKIKNLQNQVTDPSNDELQINAAKRLKDQIVLFPVLYSNSSFTVRNGIGSTTLLPRSEDPLSDLLKLSSFITTLLDNSPADLDESFSDGLTRDKLAAIGDILQTTELTPILIDSGALRELYEIETTMTIVDDYYFGQTVSETDLAIQQQTQNQIAKLLTPENENTEQKDTGLLGTNDKCFVLQHSAQKDISQSDTPKQSDGPNNPGGTGGFSQSGQSLFSKSILPLNTTIRNQLFSPIVTYFNTLDWIPQVKQRLIGNSNTITEALTEIEKIKYQIPFGSSQLYDALYTSAQIMSDENFDTTKKIIYLATDNSENLSTISRNTAIEEINSVDGDKKLPVIETVFSTSFPTTLSAMLEQTEINNVEKLVSETGGQANVLISSDFMNDILNLTISTASGGLGYGKHIRQIKFDELTAVTAISINFSISANTSGHFRYRYSKDGYQFNPFSEKFVGSRTVDFVDFFAKILEIEITLNTGFSTNILESNETTKTPAPKCTLLSIEKSSEKSDYIFINKEETIKNVQQIAASFEGTIPESSVVEIGSAVSQSIQWDDYQSASRPAINECGKSLMLERNSNNTVDSIIPPEPLFTYDGILYTSVYGPWDPSSTIELFYLDDNQSEIPVTSGFKSYPRDGQIYFDTKQDKNQIFVMKVTNQNELTIGIRLRNRLHSESIKMEGVGFIYNTNKIQPPAMGQIPPKAINVLLTPQNPTSSSTFVALYKYIDLNNDNETGSILSWYKNGIQLFEIQNKLTWTNKDLLTNNKLKPNDKIQFSITPSDGTNYGLMTFSTIGSISPQEPEAQNARIISVRNGINNSNFDTSSLLKIDYTFFTEDINTNEDGTVIKWYINGILFKEGVFSSTEDDPYNNPKEIQPGEVANGFQAHVIGNIIQVEITPKTSLISGVAISTESITISNSIPTVSSAVISPLKPTSKSTLGLTYTIEDRDIDLKIQQDKSQISWFMSVDNKIYEIQSALTNSLSVPAFYLETGQAWYAQITPNDGIDTGPSKNSNTVKIV